MELFVFGIKIRTVVQNLSKCPVALADDLAVVGGDDLPETRHCPVGHLDCLPVQQLVAGMILGEASVQDGQEPFADVGCH